MSKMHRLKTWLTPYVDVRRGAKTFEFRLNDRDYQEGDKVTLVPWDELNGREVIDLGSIVADVGTVCRGPAFGIPLGYCVFSLLNACTEKGMIRRASQPGGGADRGTMRADKLIETLVEMLAEVPSTAEVVVAGAVETVWALESAKIIDGHIVLVHGARLPDLHGTIRPTQTGGGESR